MGWHLSGGLMSSLWADELCYGDPDAGSLAPHAPCCQGGTHKGLCCESIRPDRALLSWALGRLGDTMACLRLGDTMACPAPGTQAPVLPGSLPEGVVHPPPLLGLQHLFSVL